MNSGSTGVPGSRQQHWDFAVPNGSEVRYMTCFPWSLTAIPYCGHIRPYQTRFPIQVVAPNRRAFLPLKQVHRS